MKHTKLLLIPLLLGLSSCVSIGTNPNGSQFIPGSSQVEETTIEFFEGNGQQIDKTLPKKAISYRNESRVASKEYTNDNLNDLLADTKGDTDVITYTGAQNVFFGNYGIKINKQGRQANNLQITLKSPARYVEIVSSPAFLNKLNYETGVNEFISEESAINVNGSKFVKLTKGIDETKTGDVNMSVETNATFDLGEAKSNIINIHCELYSAVIYEINFYY